MALYVAFFVSVLVVRVLGAPYTVRGKAPIGPECVPSPVVASDPVKCTRFVKTPPPAPDDQRPVLFEGDIAGVLEPGDTIADLDNQMNNLGKGATLISRRWFGAQIVYELSPDFTEYEQSVIWDAMAEFEDKTDSIQFRERESETDYIYIYKGSGCSSYVGRQGGMQYLSLDDDCVYFGTIVHELNHAIGFWHEQSRSDRDFYVEINMNNILELDQPNFQKYDFSQVTLSGTRYDFGSIMHYPKNAFAIDPDEWTIRPKAAWRNVTIGQRNGLSATDITEINAIYPLCATLWHEPDHTGSKHHLVRGQMANLHFDDQDKMSSAKVTYGCTLTTFSLVDLQQISMIFRPFRPDYLYFSFAGKDWDNKARSVTCTCF